MDLFTLILNYLDTYIFYPIDNWFSENSYSGFSLGSYYLVFDDGNFSITNTANYSKTLDGVPGPIIFQGFNLMDLLLFLSTIVIFILLFIVAVKFIVWLFKQISFITRF